MSELKPIVTENDLKMYEKYLKNTKSEKNKNDQEATFDNLIGHYVVIKTPCAGKLCSFSGLLKEVNKIYLTLAHQGGKRTLILRPEDIVSITVIR